MRTTPLVLGSLLLTSAACLVTKDVDFEVVNSPPNLERVSPVGSLAWPPTSSDMACSSGNDQTRFMLFEATVRDIDVDQTLQARLLVNGDIAAQRESGPATGNKVERTFEPFCIDVRRWLTRVCNKVELLVTSRFAFTNADDYYATALEGDLGRLEWMVLGGALDAPGAQRSDCLPPLPARDGGMP